MKTRLKHHLASIYARHEPRVPFSHNLKQGLGALVVILSLGFLLKSTGLPLLIPPFGASTLLLLGRPMSPLAQPINVFAGYLIAGVAAFISAELFPGVLWATGATLGISLMAMGALRVTHPPAGAIPLIAFAEPVGVLKLMEGLAVGSVTLVVLAMIYHRIPPRQSFPLGPVRDSPLITEPAER